MSGELTIGAVFGMFITIIIAVIQIAPALVVLDYTLELNREFRENYDALKDGDTEALNDFMENRANDLMNITIDEVESVPQDILLDKLDVMIKE